MRRPPRTLPDGRRLYGAGEKYRPVPEEERKYGRRKPDDPRAVRFHSRWFIPTDVLPDNERTMPETRPDTDAYDHMEISFLCRCSVCVRPEAERWRRKWRRENGFTP